MASLFQAFFFKCTALHFPLLYSRTPDLKMKHWFSLCCLTKHSSALWQYIPPAVEAPTYLHIHWPVHTKCDKGIELHLFKAWRVFIPPRKKNLPEMLMNRSLSKSRRRTSSLYELCSVMVFPKVNRPFQIFSAWRSLYSHGHWVLFATSFLESFNKEATKAGGATRGFISAHFFSVVAQIKCSPGFKVNLLLWSSAPQITQASWNHSATVQHSSLFMRF